MHERFQNATTHCKPARTPWDKLQKGFRKLLGFLDLYEGKPECMPHPPHQRPFHLEIFMGDEDDSREAQQHKKISKRHKHKPSRGVVRAMKRVRKANQKLVAFERGFISKKGIKDREWYKHLGVAPGKWLGDYYLTTACRDGLLTAHEILIGYGATTFPALTEALEIEQDAALAGREAKRLQRLVDKMAQNLDV